MTWLRFKRKLWVMWTKYCIEMQEAADYSEYYESGLDISYWFECRTRESRKEHFKWKHGLVPRKKSD